MESNPILILDLDGTIIGNICYQALSFGLLCLLKENDIKPTDSLKEITLSYTEKTGIIRPGFINFMNVIRSLIPNILIFIYTASERNWANKEIQWIEKNNNIKFDRPLFCREQCIYSKNTYLKSINKIFPIIKKKYKSVTINNLLIIDNNNVYNDNIKSLIVCPHYNHQVFFDLWKIISKTAMKNPIIYSAIVNYIENNMLNPCSTHILTSIGKEELKSKHFLWLYKKYKAILLNNLKYKNDIFWKKIILILKNHKITDFTNMNIFIQNVKC